MVNGQGDDGMLDLTFPTSRSKISIPGFSLMYSSTRTGMYSDLERVRSMRANMEKLMADGEEETVETE